MTKICIFGDSIVWKAHDYLYGGWVGRLRKHLAPKKIRVYNKGVSGNDTRHLLRRFKYECTHSRPDVIMIGIGINDSSYTHSKENPRIPCVPIERFKKNLAELLRQASQFTDKIIFIGLTKVDDRKTTLKPLSTLKHFDMKGAKLYDETIKDFCRRNKVKYIPMMHVLENPDLPDGLHPAVKGHKKMFDVIKAVLEKAKII
jgi:lysophospholipase L1-like esterase